MIKDFLLDNKLRISVPVPLTTFFFGGGGGRDDGDEETKPIFRVRYQLISIFCTGTYLVKLIFLIWTAS